jgi:SAM-dependent methyltransferase
MRLQSASNGIHHKTIEGAVMSRQGETRAATNENIKQFWEQEAREWGESPQVTIRDHYFRLHELHTLIGVIPRVERLLDVGCGTGFGTIYFARRAAHTLGVDFSENMIRWARRLISDAAYRAKIGELSLLWPLEPPAGELEFAVADILNLETRISGFGCISGQRILINLPTHDQQIRALGNLRAVAAPGATLVLVEATQEGHARTDAYRQRFGLPILEKYWHNNYVFSARSDEWTEVGWRLERVLHFDTYVLLSKVIYPAALGQDNCKFLSGANAAAMDIANVFRSHAAVEEIGVDAMLALWIERVRLYDGAEADAIAAWTGAHAGDLGDWSRLGHQELFIARAV